MEVTYDEDDARRYEDDQLEPTRENTPANGHWDPYSWTDKPNPQETKYDHGDGPERPKDLAIRTINRLPPLVTPAEIEKLKNSLRDCARGDAFLLQGGDCAELFEYCTPRAIEGKMKLLLQMSLVLIWGLNKPVVRVARMAGQYAKPRSSPTEVVDGKVFPSFKGDILNGFPVTERTPDPQRMVR
jgi:3-deoxy-7-phosphoheptulonate synthase